MNLIKILITLIAPLLMILLAYLVSRTSSPRARKSKDRDMPYACGEDFPPIRPQVTINLFWFAAIFLVFDIVDFLIALAYGIELVSVMIPITYLALVILALIIALRW